MNQLKQQYIQPNYSRAARGLGGCVSGPRHPFHCSFTIKRTFRGRSYCSFTAIPSFYCSFTATPACLLQFYSYSTRTAIPVWLLQFYSYSMQIAIPRRLLQFYSCTAILTAVLQLDLHSYCSFTAISCALCRSSFPIVVFFRPFVFSVCLFRSSFPFVCSAPLFRSSFSFVFSIRNLDERFETSELRQTSSD